MIFFFNDTATTEIYTLSLHDALPICPARSPMPTRILTQIKAIAGESCGRAMYCMKALSPSRGIWRSEEHTSELQSQSNLVCRLLLEKKKKQRYRTGH